MTKNGVSLLFLMIFAVPVLGNYIELKRLGMDAGSDALAGVSVYAKGSNPIFENPALLSNRLESQWLLTHRAFLDRAIMSASLLIPIKGIGSLGIGYMGSDLLGIPEAVYDAGGGRLTGNNVKYSEKLFSLSLGGQIGVAPIFVGISGQFYDQNLAGVTAFSPVINGAFLYQYDSHLQYSIVRQNIFNAPIKWSSGTHEPIPNLTKIGLSYRSLIQVIDLYGELVVQDAYQNQLNYGLSWALHPQLSFQYGGAPFGQYLGLKVELSKVQIAFSYSIPNDNLFFSQSAFTLGLHF